MNIEDPYFFYMLLLLSYYGQLNMYITELTKKTSVSSKCQEHSFVIHVACI